MRVKIQNRQASAEIESLGAQLVSWKDAEGLEHIWQREKTIWPKCSPILFPVVGNCRNDRVYLEGQWWDMPKHGPCKELEFHLKEQREDEVVFGITEEDFPENCYPYRFSLEVSYRLEGESLTIRLETASRDTREACYCIGLHPGFVCPLSREETFEDYELRFPEKPAEGYREYDTERMEFDRSRREPFPGQDGVLPLKRELFRGDAIWLDQCSCREVSLVGKKSGRGVRMEFPDYETVAFWSRQEPQAAFVCIEPWNGSAVCSDEDDSFRSKNHLQILKPGETRTYTARLTLLG